MSSFADRLKWLVATCCGFGYSPVIPGTAGALWGVAIYVPIGLAVVEPYQTIAIAFALAIVCAATVGLGGWSERFFGEKDSSRFVTDEVAGFLCTVLLFRTPSVLATTLLAFPATRLIDAAKLPPARRLEHMPRGWGVVADDLMSSVYAAVLLHVLWAFWRHGNT